MCLEVIPHKRYDFLEGLFDIKPLIVRVFRGSEERSQTREDVGSTLCVVSRTFRRRASLFKIGWIGSQKAQGRASVAENCRDGLGHLVRDGRCGSPLMSGLHFKMEAFNYAKIYKSTLLDH